MPGDGKSTNKNKEAPAFNPTALFPGFGMSNSERRQEKRELMQEIKDDMKTMITQISEF